jgi:4-amino-4-deoxy-L-arabinose transferase-like glycosyltransferase
MKIRRLVLIVGLLIAVAAFASWLLISRWEHSQSFKSLPKLVAAMQTYSHDQVSHGRPLPSSVTLQDLLGGGYISAAEVRDLGGGDVTFYPTVSESGPQAILVRVRMPDGSQTVALSDGSVQSVSR